MTEQRTAAAASVRVRLFAGARAAAGTPHADVPVMPGDLVADVLERLCVERPALAGVVPACSFLLDGVSARAQDPVAPAGELDVLPPFSGG